MNTTDNLVPTLYLSFVENFKFVISNTPQGVIGIHFKVH